MNQHELLQRISKYLSRFKEQVAILNANGEFAINVHAENALLKILEVVYDCELENMNYVEGKNYDSIDLRDKKGKYTFQITATTQLKKIKETLTTYVGNEHYKKYKRLIIVMLATKQEKYAEDGLGKIIDNKMKFSTDEDVIDIPMLYTKINELNDLGKIQHICELLEAQFSDKIEKQNKKLKTFTEICQSIAPVLRRNNAIFKEMGPNSGAIDQGPVRYDLTLWYAAREELINPNNKAIVQIISENTDLIPKEYLNVFESFLNHAFAFEKHCKDPTLDYSGQRFPKEFSSIIMKELDSGNSDSLSKEVKEWLKQKFELIKEVEELYVFGSSVSNMKISNDLDCVQKILLADNTDTEWLEFQFDLIKEEFENSFVKKMSITTFLSKEEKDYQLFLSKNTTVKII